MMNETFQPSQPGYEFRSADIIAPGSTNLLTEQAVKQIIINSGIQSNGAVDPADPASPALMGLLASLLRTTKPINAKFNMYPCIAGGGVVGGAATAGIQQILPRNENRIYLRVVTVSASGAFLTAYVLFDEAPQQRTDVNDAQSINGYINRGIRISTDINVKSPDSVSFDYPPINPVSLFATQYTQMLIIEGVRG